jgi:hypothetical protein
LSGNVGVTMPPRGFDEQRQPEMPGAEAFVSAQPAVLLVRKTRVHFRAELDTSRAGADVGRSSYERVNSYRQ